MYFIIYQITNNINGKIYIGMHQTNDLNDGYMGSGKNIRAAIKKYGIENFTKNIIQLCENKEEMKELEKNLVNEDFIRRNDTYNIKLGGQGGFEKINENILKESRKKGYENAVANGMQEKAQEALKILRQNEHWANKLKNKFTKTYRERHGENSFKSFLGKKHTEEAKRKIGEKSKIHQAGQRNSSYGKIWITDLSKRKSFKIKKEELPNYQETYIIQKRVIDFDKYFKEQDMKDEKLAELNEIKLQRKFDAEIYSKIKEIYDFKSVRELHEYLTIIGEIKVSEESLRQLLNSIK